MLPVTVFVDVECCKWRTCRFGISLEAGTQTGVHDMTIMRNAVLSLMTDDKFWRILLMKEPFATKPVSPL